MMTRRSGTNNIQVTVFLLLLLRALHSATATHNLTTNLTPIHSQRLTTQKNRHYLCVCVRVCVGTFEDVCAVYCLSLFKFCCSSSHLTL